MELLVAMTLDLSKIHPLLPKPKLTAGIVAGIAAAVLTAILQTLGADVAASLCHIGDTDVTWQAAITMLASWLGTWIAPEQAVVTQLDGFPEDDDGLTTLGTPATEYPPGGGAGPRGEAPDA
jgi:hypothetical protein